MVIEISFEDPNGGGHVHKELSYENEPFTVGRSDACSVSLPPVELSRFALVIEAHEDRRVKIKCGQSYGYVQVTREDGVRKATLELGEEFSCGAGTFRVLLKTASAEILTVEVVLKDSQQRIEPGVITVGMWSRQHLFAPTPEEDWRWVAGLATVVAQTNAARKGEALDLLAKAWHSGEWHANVQGRLDKVLERLGYRGAGNKLEAISSEVLSSGVIDAKDYRAFRDEVQRRALNYLSRADIGKLGWGYLVRGA
ncbi:MULTISPECIES: FHA domain-containing protein [unclassified Nocardioides]|uniref:FHA domain-containing protein n=1 Tax=unclassified Nocardioides TaxID=2615069 RepID=UPI0006FADF65|nr:MULTISPECIES: FHA domain-containing protein [unclassified Nocardioides]KRA37929.1 hypothetical protein ASD81_04385 [Nocardioides sp. Root614]KRA91889.1 hypothetical protein ASD84_04650 [Nocardioides sp. Root682]